MNKLWYSWDEIVRDMGVLCRDITVDHFEPDVIVGLSRGGLTPGVMLSHWLKKPFKPIKAALRDHPEWENYLPKKSDKRVLIIDDVCDSGETFTKMQEILVKNSTSGKCDVRFAVLWCNTEQPFEPDYYVHEIEKFTTDTWITFAWEEWWNPQNGYK